jgi:phosphoribosyl-ATP pyrophosphohydrolase
MSDSIDRLFRAVVAAEGADPATSRTARLLRAGRGKMAKKLAEEAIEVVIDAVNGSREAVVRESADLLYNLVVLWTASGVEPKDVWDEMDRRERLFGIAEKLLKEPAGTKSRRRITPARVVRVRKARRRHRQSG